MKTVKSNSNQPMIMWSMAVLFFMYQFIARSAFPTVLAEEYMKFFGLDALGVGTLVSCYYWAYTLSQIPAGIVIDKFKAKHVSTVSALTCASGVLLFIATRNCYIAAIGQMMVGLGSATAFLMVIKTVVSWFPEDRRAMMLSVAVSIGCLGPVVFGPFVGSIAKTYDWRMVMMLFSVCGFIIAFLLWKIITDNPAIAQGKGNVAASKATSEILKDIRDMVTNVVTSPQILVLIVVAFAMYAPISALGDMWGTSFIKKVYDVDVSICSSANNMIYVGMVLGSPLFAFLSNVMNSYKKPMSIGLFCATLVFCLIVFVSNLPIVAMFVLFFALGLFISAMLFFPLGASLFPQVMSGTVSGVLNTATMMSGVVLIPTIGWLINKSWDGTIVDGVKVYCIGDFRSGFMAVLVALVIGCVASLLVKDRSPKSV